MKYVLCCLLACLSAWTARAQNEQDFASRFMELYAKGSSMQCETVSPLMMERMLSLPSVEDDKTAKQVLSQLKSIRVISHSDSAETTRLYQHASELAKCNPNRYKSYAEDDDKKLYIRRHGGQIVEIVLFMHGKRFTLINLTGNMDEQFLQQVLAI